ncbi:MAG TPA: 5-(carboxyamino)imidazole ribonucleotide synthase [Acidimicrobiales bacterium]|nr:5-(carboxyamino)imidazole ribonucleotide synthase [Acidimicrobiales bacterium]
MIGVLGGGQLGRMLGLAGLPLGQRFVFLDPSPDAPARDVGELIVAEYDDRKALDELASRVDVVTYEFENVPAATVEALAERVPVFPSAGALHATQDRLVEKGSLVDAGIPVAPFRGATTGIEVRNAITELGLPVILKTRRGGYDGKGQAVITGDADVEVGVAALRGADLIVEGRVDFDRELSVIAVRGEDGAFAAYPLVENHHAGGILRFSLAPAPTVEASLQAKAEGFARSFMEAHDYVGVMTLELFQVGDGLLVNEVAPRVHNSGHWTIEGAEVSQFENHLRACLGLPLGATDAVGSSVMANVLGALPDVASITAIAGAHLHLYGKEPRPLRKIGHVTVRRDEREWWKRLDGGLRSLATVLPALEHAS